MHLSKQGETMFHFLKSLLLSDLQHNPPSPKNVPPLFENSRRRNLSNRILVYDVEGALLRSSSTFPYFMLVAFEGGGLLRSFLLLLLYPLLCFVSPAWELRIMVMVSFCGLRKESFRAGRAVLPKFFLEDVGLESLEILREGGMRVCVTSLPRVMVEDFLKEYLDVEIILGSELKVFHGYYTGLIETKYCKVNEVLAFLSGREQLKSFDYVGFSRSSKPLQHPLFSLCKEVCLVSEGDKRNWHSLPREKYPKPLIFHDGRLAFRPTPVATLAMLVWLALGVPLAILRLMIVRVLPYKASTPILAMTGMKWRFKGRHPSTLHSSTKIPAKTGHLFVCNHRTVIDPVYVSMAFNRSAWAVSYSISRFSEIISPIKTARLRRNREEDRKMMKELLRHGDVVVCPEGTTCREPFLLRFSPLFTELSDEIIPVALDVHVSMFYATTAGGLKWLDPFFYLLNPSMTYEVEFLEKIDTNDVKVGKCSSIALANHIQRLIGRRLGFECTMFTRKDKYLLLAGNNGTTAPSDKKFREG